MQEIDDFMKGLVPAYHRIIAEYNALGITGSGLRGALINPIVHTQLILIDLYLKRTIGEIFYRKKYYINAEAPNDLHVVVWCEELIDNTINMDCVEVMCDMFILRSSQEGIMLEFIIENAFLSIGNNEMEETLDQ